MDKYTLLQQYFGHSSFRPGQETLIDALLDGHDALGVMPTGAGKSMCYQIPALLLPGVTLVISPLISLMKDQVMALCQAGVPAAYLNSSLSYNQYCEALRRACNGAYKIIYVAPERLTTPGFLHFAEISDISLIAVDEAHCVSHWGQDFRPSYLHIPDFVDQLSRRPVVAAFTATATKEVRADIVRLLRLREPTSVTTGFDRENLFFSVEHPKDKLPRLLQLLAERRGKSGIVYCATRVNVERVCQALLDHGFEATRYHAGLDDAERRKNQEDFSYDRKPIMVATNAFGMGIDKSNVSFVIHYNMPKSLEAYYQEAGRAGRDGEKADCILLYSPGDIQTARYLIQNSPDNEDLTPEQRELVRRQDLIRLNTMVRYCTTGGCLRGYILDYFGQSHEPRCGNCGNCLRELVEVDITRQAQMILSCVHRIRDHLGYSVGASLVAGVLGGSREKRLLELHLDRLSTYGLLKDTSRRQIRDMLECLESQGYLHTDPAYGSISLTAQAREVLFQGKTVCMPVWEQPREKTPAKPSAVLQTDQALYDVLRELRYRLAKTENVPAYIVFSNATLGDMAAKAPETMDEFLQVSGVGQQKASRYGKEFLEAIRQYKSEKT